MPEAKEDLKDKPRSGVYTVLLILSCALTGGAIAFMHDELMKDYYWDQTGKDVVVDLTKRNKDNDREKDPFISRFEMLPEDGEDHKKLATEYSLSPLPTPKAAPARLPEIVLKGGGVKPSDKGTTPEKPKDQ